MLSPDQLATILAVKPDLRPFDPCSTFAAEDAAHELIRLVRRTDPDLADYLHDEMPSLNVIALRNWAEQSQKSKGE
jgi:hypothetical protein